MIKREQVADQKMFWLSDRVVHNVVPLHWHVYYEVELCLAGEGVQICNSLENELHRGTLTLLSPRDFHQLQSNSSEGVLFKTFCFQEDVLTTELLALLQQAQPPFVFQLDAREFETIYADFCYLDHVLNNTHRYRAQIAPRQIELILLKLLEIARFQLQLQPRQYADEKKQRDLQPVIAYINEHYNEPISRDELAAMLHFSPTYLSNTFKKTFGISISEYIINCRMKNAKAMLKHGNESIKNTMEKVGYNSASLFYKHFFKYYGIKPSDIQRKKNENP
jgi:AraC-like DNA-binding protein